MDSHWTGMVDNSLYSDRTNIIKWIIATEISLNMDTAPNKRQSTRIKEKHQPTQNAPLDNKQHDRIQHRNNVNLRSLSEKESIIWKDKHKQSTKAADKDLSVSKHRHPDISTAKSSQHLDSISNQGDDKQSVQLPKLNIRRTEKQHQKERETLPPISVNDLVGKQTENNGRRSVINYLCV